DDADVDEKASGQRIEAKPALYAAAGHVGHLVLAVDEAVDGGQLDPSRPAVELTLETEPPILLVPIFGRVHVNRLAVEDQAPILRRSGRGKARGDNERGTKQRDSSAHDRQEQVRCHA